MPKHIKFNEDGDVQNLLLMPTHILFNEDCDVDETADVDEATTVQLISTEPTNDEPSINQLYQNASVLAEIKQNTYTHHIVINQVWWDCFRTYLQSTIGGNQTPEHSTTIQNRIQRLLIWTQETAKDTNNTLEWVKILIKHKYNLVSAYCTYLEITQLRSPATIKANVMDFNKFLHWYCNHREGQIPKCKNKHLLQIHQVTHQMSKTWSAANRKRQSSGAKSLETKINTLQFPPNGMQDLRRVVDIELDWVKQYYTLVIRGTDSYIHDKTMGIIFTSLYTYAAQGRISGVADLKATQMTELVSIGHAMSTQFKTASKFGYQPVIVAPDISWLIHLYQQLRTNIVSNTGTTNPWLWLTVEGTRENDIGGKVIACTVRTLHRNLTSTGIRSMVEMESNDAYKQGKITAEERDAVHDVNGHSSQVTKDYYQLERMTDSVMNATSAFQAINPATPSPPTQAAPASVIHLSPSPAQLTIMQSPIPAYMPQPPPPGPPTSTQAPPASMQQQQFTTGGISQVHRVPSIPASAWMSRTRPRFEPVHWGRDHPIQDEIKRRVLWSDGEMGYIGVLYRAQVQSNPDNMERMACRILEVIRQDPLAHAIFHPLHVTNTAKLRNGIRSFEKAHGIK
jgi:hypothetical protein